MLDHHRHANKTPIKWLVGGDDGRFLVLFGSSLLPHQLRKNSCRVGPPLTKLSVSVQAPQKNMKILNTVIYSNVLLCLFAYSGTSSNEMWHNYWWQTYSNSFSHDQLSVFLTLSKQKPCGSLSEKTYLPCLRATKAQTSLSLSSAFVILLLESIIFKLATGDILIF